MAQAPSPSKACARAGMARMRSVSDLPPGAVNSRPMTAWAAGGRSRWPRDFERSLLFAQYNLSRLLE
jgi:hypothetical protein